MQDDNNSWDIMQDLEFLIASDCQLKDELDHVCDLLDSDSSPDELTPPTAAATASDKKKRRSRNNRYKQDILQLRAQVESLKEELLKARANTSTADMSVWELAARRERMESLRSQMENQDLRAAVEERASFIDNMKRLLCKKPRWITVERIDDFTVYERYNHALGETTRHSNSIRKHYPCADRDVMVWRTVLEDALVPHMSKCTVDDSWGW
ncbi:unnamed protein product [Aphanomyces euteiches]